MISVEHLVKDYGTVVAVKDVSFTVGKGEVVGFLGPNGAGKSTTLRVLAGFLGPTSGRVTIDGIDVVEEGPRARRSLGYMPEAAPIYPEMRVREYLQFRAELKGVRGRDRKAAVARAMESARVSDMEGTLVEHLSKGYKQRVALADALVANPPLLILDEPTAGLDPNQIREVRDLIRSLGENHTILLSTHILPEVESTCTRAIVIDRGRLVAEGTVEELRDRRRGSGGTIVAVDPDLRAVDLLQNVPGVASVTRAEASAHPPGYSAGSPLARLSIAYAPDAPRDGSVMSRAVESLVGAGIAVREATPIRATLEEVFAELTVAEALPESPKTPQPPDAEAP
jgi:ABC-2 type transport system ATP-binding protein